MIFDVIIIGAGPAGLTAVHYLKRAEKNILLIDKYKFPKDKICGDFILPKCKNIINDILGKENSFDNIGYKSNALSYNINNIHFNFDIENENVVMCKRQIFDNLLFDHIKDDIEFVSNEEVVEIEKQSDYFCLKSINSIKFRETIYKATYVIDARGATNKLLYKKFPIELSEFSIASRSYIQNSCNLTTPLVFYDKTLAPGYFWAFPMKNNLLNCGVLLFKGQKTSNINELHSMYIKKHLKVKTISNFNKWIIPYNFSNTRLSKDNYIYIGDKAGLVDPLYGHGIDTAMMSGQIAAKSIINSRVIKPEELDGVFKENIKPILKIFKMNYKYRKIYKDSIQISAELLYQNILINIHEQNNFFNKIEFNN